MHKVQRSCCRASDGDFKPLELHRQTDGVVVVWQGHPAAHPQRRLELYRKGVPWGLEQDGWELDVAEIQKSKHTPDTQK